MNAYFHGACKMKSIIRLALLICAIGTAAEKTREVASKVEDSVRK